MELSREELRIVLKALEASQKAEGGPGYLQRIEKILDLKRKIEKELYSF